MPKWLHPSPIWRKWLKVSMIHVESTKYAFTCLHPRPPLHDNLIIFEETHAYLTDL